MASIPLSDEQTQAIAFHIARGEPLARETQTVLYEHAAWQGREIASLREQVRALTAERDAFIASLEREAQVADSLRARVAEVDAAHLLLDRAGQSPVQPHLGLRIQALLEKCDEGWRRAKALESERDAAQQRAKALEDAVRDMLGSADCEWENRRAGHDWADAVQSARTLLTKEEAP